MCEETVTFKAQWCRIACLLRKQTVFGFVVSVLLIRKWNGTTQYHEISAFWLTLAPVPFTSVFLLIRANSFRRTIERMNASHCLCFLSSLPVQMYLTSLNQGYFLTVSQPPLPWVMVCRDSLSDSDEVMSEPRTKLSLPFPTDTPSLLAVYRIGLFFRSNTAFYHIVLPLHTPHTLFGRIHNAAVRQGKM